MVQKTAYSNLSQATEAKLLEFRQPESLNGGGASVQQYQQLRKIISLSDKLATDVNLAVANKDMLGFRIDTQLNNTSMSGVFIAETQLLKLNPNTLNSWNDRYYAIMTTAHEVQHALDKVGEYTNNIKNKLQVQSSAFGFHDYTDEVKDWLFDNRKLEARAEITGFNAVVSALHKEKGRVPTLQEIFMASPDDMQNFIVRVPNPYTQQYEYQWQTSRYNPNLSYQPNTDMMLSHKEPNLNIIASHFFDSTYPNRLAANVIKEAIKYESENSKIYLNMKELTQYGITIQGLQRYGVDFNKIIDISAPMHSLDGTSNNVNNNGIPLGLYGKFNSNPSIENNQNNLGTQVNDLLEKLQLGAPNALAQFVTANSQQLTNLKEQSIQQAETLNKLEQTMTAQAEPAQNIEPETRSTGRSL